MKILMINKFLYPNGGSETYIFKLGEYLQKCGHDVQFFGMFDSRNIVGNKIGAYTRHMDFHQASLMEKITYPAQIIYSIDARRQIRRVLDNFQPDVCHLNNFNYQLTPSIILEIVSWRKEHSRSCRIVYTAHDGQLVCPNHMLRNPRTHENCLKCVEDGDFRHCYRESCLHGSRLQSLLGTVEGFFWRWRQVYRYLDAVVCPSKFMQGILEYSPDLAGKTLVLHNFVEKWEKILPDKKDYVLYFGRYSEEKGINLLLSVCKQMPEIPFVFVGSGPLSSLIHGVSNINELGFQTGKNLVDLIQKARFSVYPSTWFENCPFSVIESQMYCTPVLGAAIGGIPELIVEGQTGETFIAGDERDLMMKLRGMYFDKKRLDVYTNNCLNYKCVDIEDYVEKLVEVYAG